jgi:hypothetical protein
MKPVAARRDGLVAVFGRRDRPGVLDSYDLRDGSLLQALVGHDATVTDVKWSADGRLLVSASEDGTVRVFKADDGSSVVLIDHDAEWIIFNDKGFFDSSRAGSRWVRAIRDREAFTMEQLAPSFNRPDRVLETIGTGDPATLDYFRKHAERRARALGLSGRTLGLEHFNGAPSVRISAVEVAGNRARLRVDGRAVAADIVRLDTFVNGSLVSSRPFAPTKRCDETVEVALAHGPNHVEVSVSDRHGVESLRAEEDLTQGGEQPTPPSLYFLGVAVGRYSSPGLNTLRYPVADVEAVAATLKKLPRVRAVHVRTILDEAVDSTSVAEAHSFLAEAKVDDIVVVLIAGHGAQGSDAANPFLFLTARSDVDRLEETSLSRAAFENLMGGLESRHKLMLIDACQSGDSDDDLGSGVDVAPSSNMRSVRGTILTTPFGRWKRPLDRDRYIYQENLGQSGAIVISSSRGREAAFESDELAHGAFSFALLQALSTPVADADHNGSLELHELREYIVRTVPVLTADRQHPTIDRDNPWSRFSLPLTATGTKGGR